MVRTRLSGGNEDSTDLFVSRRRRDSGTKKSRIEPEEIVSTIRDGHLYDSPRRKQSPVFDLGSGESVSNATYSTRRRTRPKDYPDPSPTGESDSSGDGPVMSPRRTRQRIALSPDEASNDEDEDIGRRRASTKRSSSPELRRSSRKRKPLYATMDQTALVGGYEYTDDMFEWGTRTRSRAAVPREETKAEQPEREEDNKAHEGSVHEDEEEDDGDYQVEDENNNEEDDDDDDDTDGLDMYSRVRHRHIKAREMREAKRREEEESRRKAEERDTEDESTEEEAEETEEDTSDDEDEEIGRSNYHLRQHRPLTQRFEVPVEAPMRRRRKSEIEEVFGAASSPIRRRYPKTRNHLTPIRSPRFARRMHHATHNSSSTSSEGSGDEQRFERRKSKSMAKARMRCLPMNLNAEDVSTGTLRDRQKVGSSLADVDPMNVDSSITFDSVGGLNKHIQSLKEMIVFPLLYPEVFDKFKISPPRGVLFHGPPGTGKTLIARALANECRSGDKKVAFFMRKGADCLSKWVGESERQLRLLFDQAYTMRPSIIFFDEIDGLAPVRSSRQDQIHSSIVSTLLALMDGLDSRGEIVIIGATNRIDSIDPALRRPGRFDREFAFQLPSCEARKSILTIHTKDWSPKLAESFLAEVAEKCVGYCGADLKALCTETALNALRHQFPQVYASKEKLQLDLGRIEVSARDFHLAMQNIVPAAQRAVVSPGRALSPVARPLLQRQLDFIVERLRKYFPVAFNAKKGGASGSNPGGSQDVFWDLLNGDVYDDEDDGPSIFETPNPWKKRRTDETQPTTFLNFSGSSFTAPSAFRPRLLLVGAIEQGHSTHVAPALLHHIEGIPVHCLDLPALYAVSAKTPEESCAQVFREARRSSPSVIYMPHIVQWWNASGYTLQATFLTLLHDLPPSAPVLLLATADCPMLDLPFEIKSLFHSHHEQYTMRNPTTDERTVFFTELIITEAAKPPPKRKKIAAKALEALPVATPVEPRSLTEQELSRLRDSEEGTLRELRIFLREVLARLAHERKFRTFTKAVDPEEVPDYFVVIRKPMDLSTMLNKINLHEYRSGRDFLVDIDLITSNALEYNPDQDPSDRQIRNYACELKDMAHAIVDAEMDPDFERMCCDIAKSRQDRGDVVKSKDPPSYYQTIPQQRQEEAQANAKNNPAQPAIKRRPFPRVMMSPFRAIKRRRSSAWARGFIPKKKYPAKKKDDESKGSGDNGGEEEATTRINHTVLGIQRRVIKRKRRSTWSRGFIRKPKKKVKRDEDAEEPAEGCGDEPEKGDENEESAENRMDGAIEGSQVEGVDEEKGRREEEGLEGAKGGEGGAKEVSDEERAGADQQEEGSGNEEMESKEGEKHVGDSGQDTDEYVNDKVTDGKDSDVQAAEKPKSVNETDDASVRESEAATENKPVMTNGVEASDDESIKSGTLEPKVISGQVEAGGAVEVNGEHERSNEERVGESNGMELGTPSKDQETTINTDEPVQQTREAGIPIRRVTRRMLTEVHATRAIQILEEPEPDLVVDTAKLQSLLESVVQMTSNWTVSNLEKIHCRLSQCIYRHRAEYDKTSLILEMDGIVQSLLTDQ